MNLYFYFMYLLVTYILSLALTYLSPLPIFSKRSISLFYNGLLSYWSAICAGTTFSCLRLPGLWCPLSYYIERHWNVLYKWISSIFSFIGFSFGHFRKAFAIPRIIQRNHGCLFLPDIVNLLLSFKNILRYGSRQRDIMFIKFSIWYIFVSIPWIFFELKKVILD